MFFQSWILFVVGLLMAFLMLVAIVWTIIKWNNKQNRNIGCALTLLFFIFTIGCAIIISIKAVHFFKNTVPAKIEKGKEVISELAGEMNSNTTFMDSIKSLQPTDSVIPETYFTYAGFRDYYRMPLVYPFSLSTIDALSYGTINDESGIHHIAKDANKSKQLFHGITSFVFDKKLLLAKIESFSNDDIKYILFDFDTRQAEEFSTEAELKEKAASMGFDTKKSRMTIKEYYSKF